MKSIQLDVFPNGGFVACYENAEYENSPYFGIGSTPEDAVCLACRRTGCGVEDVEVTFAARSFMLECDFYDSSIVQLAMCGPSEENPCSIKKQFDHAHSIGFDRLVKYRRLILPIVEEAVQTSILLRKEAGEII